jgi:hypothetical protein
MRDSERHTKGAASRTNQWIEMVSVEIIGV